MKRILSFLLILLLLVSGLSACTKFPDEEESATEPAIQDISQNAENSPVAENEVVSSIESSAVSLPEDATINQPAKESVADDKLADLEVLPETIPLYKYSEFISDDDADGILLSEYAYTYITVPAEVADQYPDAACTVEEYTGMLQRTVGDERENMTANAKEARAQDPENFIVYSTALDVLVRRADSTAFSFLEQYSANNGTETSEIRYNAINIDTASGEYLKLSDVIENMDMLPQLVLRELEKICFDILPSVSELEDYFLNTPEADMDWSLDSNGVTFYFGVDQFEYLGGTTVTLLFEANEGLYSKKYTQAPESYMVELPQDIPFYFDMNKDGVAESVSFSVWFDGESGQYVDFGIYSSEDGVYYYEEYASERIYPFFLRTPSGHFVSVLCENYEAGECIATVKTFLIESGDILLVNEINGASVYTDGNTLLISGNPENLINSLE